MKRLWVFPFIVMPMATGYGWRWPCFVRICTEEDGSLEVTEEFLRCIQHSVFA